MTDNKMKAREFVEHIVAHPDDDAARLIFADWLEEHGEHTRSEFIRVQVERASLPKWDGRHVPLRLRENALLKEHGPTWKAELPSIEGISWEELRRGFVATARVQLFSAFAKNAKACWAATPLEAITYAPGRLDDTVAPIPALRELTLTGGFLTEDDAGQLATAPLLSTLHALNICGCNLGGDGFRRLVASPHLGKLRALRVPGNAIGNQAIRGLYDAKSLTSLEELDLSETGSYGRSRGHGRYREDPVIEATDLKLLARWSGLARVRALTLSGNAAGREGLRALVSSPHATALKELIMRANGFDGQAMQEFRNAHAALKLDVLDLGDNILGDVGASDLALAPCLSELKMLELDRCEIRLSGARWLVNAPFRASLRRLNLNDNYFGPEGVYRLLEKKPPVLHTLYLAHNDLGDEGAAHLAESPASAPLLDLDLSRNDLSDQAAQIFGKTRQLKNLLVLRLHDNPISKTATAALANSNLGKRLAVLRVIDDKDSLF